MSMTYAEYHAAPGIRASSLKLMRRSPMHYQYALQHPKDATPAMVLGKATHTAVFEPARFLPEYTMWKGGRRSGKVWDSFVADAGVRKQTILTKPEYNTAQAIADSVRADPDAAEVLADGVAEQSFSWEDLETGLACKCRPDWLTPDGGIWDLKTARDIDPRQFGAAAARLGYWFQLALYRVGVHTDPNTPPVERCGIIAVESSPPYDVAVYTITDVDAAEAEAEVEQALARVAECTASGVWPGAGHGGPLPMPEWARAQGDAVDFSGIE